MYALDKVEKKFAIKVNTFLKLEARVDASDEKRKSVSAIGLFKNLMLKKMSNAKR